MGTVEDLDSCRKHKMSKVICLKCLHRWLCVRPTQTFLEELECPNCGHIGAVIETGEDLFN